MTDRQNEDQRTRAQHEIRKLIERNAVALQHQQQQVAAAAAAAAAAASRTTPPSTPSGGGGAVGHNGIGSAFHGAAGALGGGAGESKVSLPSKLFNTQYFSNWDTIKFLSSTYA